MKRLGQKADELGMLSALSRHERTVLLPWRARGVIGNGGFKYFYDGTSNLAPVAQALRALGFAAAADACERVEAGIFLEEPLPEDEALRRSVLAGVDWSQFDQEEDEVFAVKWNELSRPISRMRLRAGSRSRISSRCARSSAQVATSAWSACVPCGFRPS